MTDMSTSQILFRDAQQTDAREIAGLFRVAAGGVADVVWDGLREGKEDAVDTGARRFARDGVAFSYRNCTLVESRDRVIGMLLAYPMRAEPGTGPDEVPPVLRPYAELEADATYYIAGIAVDPDLRGRGIGTKLLRVAELRAMTRGLDAMSLIAFEENYGSIRLYERLGYRVADRRPVVPHPMIRFRGDAVLMVKDLA